MNEETLISAKSFTQLSQTVGAEVKKRRRREGATLSSRNRLAQTRRFF